MTCDAVAINLGRVVRTVDNAVEMVGIRLTATANANMDGNDAAVVVIVVVTVVVIVGVIVKVNATAVVNAMVGEDVVPNVEGTATHQKVISPREPSVDWRVLTVAKKDISRVIALNLTEGITAIMTQSPVVGSAKVRMGRRN